MPRRRDDHDDYDDRPPHRNSGSDAGSIAIKILAIIGGVILGIVLICSGSIALVYYGMFSLMGRMQDERQVRADKMRDEAAQNPAPKTEREEAEQFAESFLKVVREGRLDDAYQSTTPDYQKRVSRKEFTAFVDDNPAVKWPQPMFDHAFDRPDGGARHEFRFRAPDRGKIPEFKLVVVKEGLNWKIDDFKPDEPRLPGVP